MHPGWKPGNSKSLEVGAGVLCLSILPEDTDLNLEGKDSLPRCVAGRPSEERKIKRKTVLEIKFVSSKMYVCGCPRVLECQEVSTGLQQNHWSQENSKYFPCVPLIGASVTGHGQRP